MAIVTRIKGNYLSSKCPLPPLKKKEERRNEQRKKTPILWGSFSLLKVLFEVLFSRVFMLKPICKLFSLLFSPHEMYPRLYDKKLYGANNLFKTRSLSHIHPVLWNQIDAEGDFFPPELSDHLYCAGESNSRYWGCQLCGDVQTRWRKIYMIF